MISWTGQELLKQARFANGSLGEGVTMSADEVSTDLIALNMLLASWDVTIYANVQETKVLTPGDGDYTWGTGGNINTVRPIDMVDQTFIRDGGSDYPVSLIRQESYNIIGDKTETGRPETVFFDPQTTLAYLYFWPIPDAAYTVYLTSLKGLSEITDVTAVVSVTPDVAAALKWNLAVELAPNYNVPVSTVMATRAQQTKAVVLNRAFKYRIVPAQVDNVTGRVSGTSDNILRFG